MTLIYPKLFLSFTDDPAGPEVPKNLPGLKEKDCILIEQLLTSKARETLTAGPTALVANQCGGFRATAPQNSIKLGENQCKSHLALFGR